MNLNFLKNPYVLGGSLAAGGGAGALYNHDEHTPLSDIALGSGLGIMAGRIPGLKDKLAGRLDRFGRDAHDAAQVARHENLAQANLDIKSLERAIRKASATRREALKGNRGIRGDIKKARDNSALYASKTPEVEAQELLDSILNTKHEGAAANRYAKLNTEDGRKDFLARNIENFRTRNEANDQELAGLLQDRAAFNKRALDNKIQMRADSSALAERQRVFNNTSAAMRQAVADRAVRNQQLASVTLGGTGALGVLGAGYLNPYGD